MTNNATSYDVREALAFRLFAHESYQDEEFVRRVWANHPDKHPVKRLYLSQADALLADATFEVRPRGTVPAEQISDAEVEAAREQAKWAHLSLFGNDGPTDEKWDRILHAALKAAWEVRNAAH